MADNIAVNDILSGNISWAKNGRKTEFSRKNYETGWAFLGDEPPTVEDFNYVFAKLHEAAVSLQSSINTINQDRTGYAPKASPAFTGIPTAPTAAAGTNNAQIATTAFVKTAIAATSAAVKTAYDKAEGALELARTKQDAPVLYKIDLSTLVPDKYYLISLTPDRGMVDGRRWQFEVRRPLYLNDHPRVPWATHPNGGFSLQASWSSNADAWGANRSHRTTEAFEFAWTNQSPLIHIGQLDRVSVEFCYLRGGSVYEVYAPEGFVVQHHTEALTRKDSTRPSPIDYDASLLPKVDTKLIRELYPEAVRHKQLTELLPNSSTQRWQSALPNELPFGTVMGFSQRSILNTNDKTYSGWGMVSRTQSTDAATSVRFGINFGKFYVQQAKSETEWGNANEVVMARTLTTEHLNNITGVGVYCQTDIAQSTATLNYPETQGGTLWVSPTADGVLQEYTVNNGHKYVRSNPNGAWGAWQRVDAVDLTDLFIGVPIPHPLSTVPAGCLAMNGQRFDKYRYPKLAQKYPSGQLPDLRGEFIRGWDNGRDVDAWRGVLTTQGDAIPSTSFVVVSNDFGGYEGSYARTSNVEIVNNTYSSKPGEGWVNLDNKDVNYRYERAYRLAQGTSSSYTFWDLHSRISFGSGNEVRPRNIAFHYICLAA